MVLFIGVKWFRELLNVDKFDFCLRFIVLICIVCIYSIICGVNCVLLLYVMIDEYINI